jgi:hypothetical protein
MCLHLLQVLLSGTAGLSQHLAAILVWNFPF